MNENAKKICNEHKAKSDNCRQTCPLAKACDYHTKDTKERYNDRMNAAADAIVEGVE